MRLPRLRRLLPPALAALVAVTLAVPVTWAVAGAREPAGPPPLPPLPEGPFSQSELYEQLLAQLPHRDAPGAVVATVSNNEGGVVGLAPARYRGWLVCGVMSQQGQRVRETEVLLRTPEEQWQVSLPCPSTVLTFPEPLDFSGEPAGAVSVWTGFGDAEARTFLLVLQLVPDPGGSDG